MSDGVASPSLDGASAQEESVSASAAGRSRVLRLRLLFLRVEPDFCRFLPGGPRFRVELVDKTVELKIGLAVGARDQVPFGGVNRAQRGALTPGQNERQAVLGDRAVVECGFVEDQRRGGFVAFNAVAVEKRDGEFDLRVGIVGERGLNSRA